MINLVRFEDTLTLIMFDMFNSVLSLALVHGYTYLKLKFGPHFVHILFLPAICM